MLKLTYTEMGLHLERLTQSLDSVVANRTVLAIRLGQTLHIEPGRAAFLLPSDVPHLDHLYGSIQRERSGDIDLCDVDTDYVEVSLAGTWVAADVQAETGMFLTVLGDRTESLVHHLWQLTQIQVSFLI